MLLCFIGGLALSRITLTKEEESLNQLEISEEVLRLNSVTQPTKTSCFVTIKNNSRARRGNFSLQAEFFDQQGNLIDLHHHNLKSSVYPLLRVKARVTGNINGNLTDYTSCKISVVDANGH
ncbi:MAG: hypothetical protein COB04_17765 [Gammaproteobacteria bacterium]|nr:MAG: hypothetical protein COB04_17765 [Gammaproteobacteria bacterium]